MLVKPDSNLDFLLSNPVRAFHEIFGFEIGEAGVAEVGWKNHLFCQVIYSRTLSGLPLLSAWLFPSIAFITT